jgi:hypothetical protein
LAKAEKKRDALEVVDELTDENADRFDVLEDEIAALEAMLLVWSDRQKAKSGVVVGIRAASWKSRVARCAN